MLLNRQRVKFWQKIIFGAMALLMAGFLIFGYSGVASGCHGNGISTGNSALDQQAKAAQAALKKNPSDSVALLQMAQVYQAQGNTQTEGSAEQATSFAKALDFYDRYLALPDKTLGTGARGLRFDALANVAAVQIRLFALKDVVRTYQKMLKLQPHNTLLYLQLGSAADQARETKAALKAFSTYLKLEPKSQYTAQVKARIAALSASASPTPSASAVATGQPSPSPSTTK
jgi:cytochrome c-type biogenesis protein CcmH/NrfG